MFHKVSPKGRQCLAALSLLLASLCQALPEDTQQEVVILSDRAEIDRKTGIVIYEGHVVLTQGTLRIESDRLTIIRNDNVLEQAIAEGQPARYQQQVTPEKPLTKAAGNRIDYFANRREVTVKGEAWLEQDGNTFSGEKLLYNMADETVKATGSAASGEVSKDGNNRIRMVIQPHSQSTPADTESGAQTQQ